MSEPESAAPPLVVGRIGITLLCVYLLAVAVRISGCYGPDGRPRDELPSAGPAIGSEFPAFRLRDVSGTEMSRDAFAGATVIVTIVPSLDWSPPTKARLLDLAEAARARRDVRIAVVMPAAQATPRALRFVHDRSLPFYYLVDDGTLIQSLGLAAPAPDGTAAAHSATFVLDRTGRVVVRDVRKDARTWPAPPLLLEPAGASP